jgi:hypothetical protein
VVTAAVVTAAVVTAAVETAVVAAVVTVAVVRAQEKVNVRAVVKGSRRGATGALVVFLAARLET